jgi:hypothetical protein
VYIYCTSRPCRQYLIYDELTTDQRSPASLRFAALRCSSVMPRNLGYSPFWRKRKENFFYDRAATFSSQTVALEPQLLRFGEATSGGLLTVL